MCAQMRYFILSDNIGEILVRLEGFELSTPGSGDLQMRMTNYMKFNESDTVAFPAVPIPLYSHLGNFQDANCARLCAQLFFFRPIQALHACLRYQPCAAGLAELLAFFKTRRKPLLSWARLLYCDRRNSPTFCSFRCRHHFVDDFHFLILHTA